MLYLKEHTSDNYGDRTSYNVNNSDFTIALAVDFETGGEKLTKELAKNKYIGFLLTDNVDIESISEEIYNFMLINGYKSFNIAGNGIYTLIKNGFTQYKLNKIVYFLIKKLSCKINIEKIYSGGQTGVDFAGIVVGDYLNIDVLVTLPKNFKQRNINGIDFIQTENEFISKINTDKKMLDLFVKKNIF